MHLKRAWKAEVRKATTGDEAGKGGFGGQVYISGEKPGVSELLIPVCQRKYHQQDTGKLIVAIH